MENKEEIDEIEEIKKEYSKLAKKHGLPKFEDLAEDFDIERVVEKETSYLLREVRRAMNDKTASYLHLFENLLNPAGPPMFIFSILKTTNEEEKRQIGGFYKILSKWQIQVMKLDTVYNEENEAMFIRNVFNSWQEMKGKIFKIMESFEKRLEDNSTSEKKGYFG